MMVWKHVSGIAGVVIIIALMWFAAGCLMTEFLVRCIESDNVMFIRDVNPTAWVFAVIVETIFTVIINAVSYRQVGKWKLTDINS